MLFENIQCVSKSDLTLTPNKLDYTLCILYPTVSIPHANGNSQWSQQGSQHLPQWEHLGHLIIRWLLYNFNGDDSNNNY